MPCRISWQKYMTTKDLLSELNINISLSNFYKFLELTNVVVKSTEVDGYKLSSKLKNEGICNDTVVRGRWRIHHNLDWTKEGRQYISYLWKKHNMNNITSSHDSFIEYILH